jgi:thiol-disulfide isomerase/thioredoxin
MNTIDVVYVTAPRCHFCERGRTVLADLADRYPLQVREVALTSEEGREIAARSRVPYPPVVLVDGHLAGYGRLSARGLDRFLADRTGVRAGVQT